MLIAHIIEPWPYKPQAFLLQLLLLLFTYKVFKKICGKKSKRQNWVAAIACGLVMAGILYIPHGIEYIFTPPYITVFIALTLLIIICFIATRKSKILIRCLFIILYSFGFTCILFLTLLFSTRTIPCNFGLKEQITSNIFTLSAAAQQYHSEYQELPDSLQSLVDTNYLGSIDFATIGYYPSGGLKTKWAKPSTIKLPKNAPDDLIFMWYDPNLFLSENPERGMPESIYIIRHNWQREAIKTNALEAEIQRSRKWVIENQEAYTDKKTHKP